MTKFVRDVMNRRVITCTPETTVRQAARRMVEYGVNALVVVTEATGELVGLVSRSDLARAYDQDYDTLTVEAVMSQDVETIIPDIPVAAAVQIMLDRGVDWLVIQHAAPATPRPVGVLSLSDVVREMAG